MDARWHLQETLAAARDRRLEVDGAAVGVGDRGWEATAAGGLGCEWDCPWMGAVVSGLPVGGIDQGRDHGWGGVGWVGG